MQLVLWIRTMICYLEIFHSVCMPAAIHWPRLSFQKVSQIRVLCFLILLYQSRYMYQEPSTSGLTYLRDNITEVNYFQLLAIKLNVIGE